MARTAPVPNIPAIPGMNPGVFIMGGGGGGGGKGGKGGKGAGGEQGANGENGGDGADGGGDGACAGGPGTAGGCPNHHAGNSGNMVGGDPVDAVTGRVFEGPLTDAHTHGPLGMTFARSYSSRSGDRDVGLGHGWSHSFSWTIRETRRNTIVHNAVGMPLEFDALLNPGDVGLGPSGLLLVRTPRGYVIDEPNGRKLVFQLEAHQRWLLSSIVDDHGNVTSLAYDERQFLSEIVDPAGRTMRLRRAPSGRITSVALNTAPSGGRWLDLHRYDYDNHGDLVRVTDVLGAATDYRYVDHRLVEKRDPEGFTFHYVYDGEGRCTETWGTHADPSRLGLAESAAAAFSDGVAYRGMFHCRLDFFEDGYVELMDGAGLKRIEGNSHGKCDQAVVGGAVFSRTYDERGHLLSFTDPNGNTSRWERDGRGRPTLTSDPLGRATIIDREADGHISMVTYPDGGTTRVSRGAGWIAWKDPIGAQFEVRFDERGLPIETHAPNGAVTRCTYDTYGNLVEKKNGMGQSVLWTYDYWGRKTSWTDATGHTERYQFNDRGDCTAVRLADGTTHRREHDKNGHLIGVLYPSGSWQRLEVGIAGKLLSVKRANGDVRTLRYDRHGRLVEGLDARGQRYTFSWDARNLITRETTFAGLEKHYRYDALGLLIEERRSNGDVISFTYDACGQVLTRTINDDYEEAFEYDLAGRLIMASGPGGAFSYRYNQVGWAIEETHTLGDSCTTVTTDYDAMGHVVRRASSLGHSVAFERDPVGRGIRCCLDDKTIIERSFDAAGRETERSLPAGGRISTRYDSRGRMAEHLVLSAAAAASSVAWVGDRPPGTVAARAYGYDGDGLLESIVDDEQGRTSLTHDAAGWITRVDHASGREEIYHYDANGNVYGGEPRQYGRGNALESCGERRYTHDDAGRLVAVSEGERETRYRWTGHGLLEAVERPDGVVVRFAYDPFARRVEKRVSQRQPGGWRDLAVFRYVWSGAELVHEIAQHARDEGDPIVEERTFFGDENAQQTIAQRTGDNGWRHFVNDEVGFPERVVDDHGRVVHRIERSAFGEVLSEDGDTTIRQRFAGQYADEETGLHYNRYRYFDPKLGRYISPDPAGLGPGFNGFDYVDNAPDQFIDPTGLLPFSVVRNPEGTDPETGDRTDPSNTARREDQRNNPPLGGNSQQREKDIAGHQGDGNVVGRSASERRRDQPQVPDPAITEAVKNAQAARGENVTGESSCAEVDALHQMAGQIRDDPDFKKRTRNMTPDERNAAVRGELQQRFRDGATIETTNGDGEGMAPCGLCAQIFRELGLHPANIGDDARGGVIGPSDTKRGRNEKRVPKLGRWDGNIVQPKENVNSRSTRAADTHTQPSSTPPFTGT